MAAIMNQEESSLLKDCKKMSHFDWIYKSLDAALTAHIKPRQGARDLVRAVVHRRSSNYNRIASLINLFDRLRPGLAQKAAGSLLQTNRLPLSGYQVRLLAFGTGATVFLLENEQEQTILKIFRRSLGKPGRQAWEIARMFQEKYHKLAACFNDPYEIVIPSTFLVMHGPLLGAPSAAVWQPFVPGKKYDLFLDFTIEEIIQFANEDEALRLQLLDFSRRLFKAVEDTGWCFDLAGKENLMLVEQNGERRLKIADNGMVDMQQAQKTNPALFNRLHSHLNQLRLIQGGLERRPTSQIDPTGASQGQPT